MAVIALVAVLLVVAIILTRLYSSFADLRIDPLVSNPPAAASNLDLRNRSALEDSKPEVLAAESFDSSGITLRQESAGPTVEETAAQKRWEHEHGYRYDDRARYINLTDGELRGLADAGDISAIQFLAARSAVSNPSTAIRQYEEAAIFGSTYSLIAIAELLRLHDSLGTALLASQGSPTLGVEALKYTFVAELRGNNIASGIKTAEIIFEYGLSNVEIEHACSEAKQLLHKLEQQKIQLTGSPFDNSESPFGEPLSQTDKHCR